MSKSERSINPPSVVFNSAKLANGRQGEYDYLSKTAFLIPPKQFANSIQEQRSRASMQLGMEEFFPGQNPILLNGLESYVDYCDNLLKNANAQNKRWDSIAAHEIAHHIFTSSIDGYEKLDYLLRNPKEIANDLWSKISRFAVLFRGLEELNSTLFELSQYRDQGAVFILIEPLWERVFYDPFSEGTQIEDIRRISSAEPLSGEYGLAAFIEDFFVAKENVDLIIKNYENKTEKIEFGIDKVDSFLKNEYNSESLESLLK